MAVMVLHAFYVGVHAPRRAASGQTCPVDASRPQVFKERNSERILGAMNSLFEREEASMNGKTVRDARAAIGV